MKGATAGAAGRGGMRLHAAATASASAAAGARGHLVQKSTTHSSAASRTSLGSRPLTAGEALTQTCRVLWLIYCIFVWSRCRCLVQPGRLPRLLGTFQLGRAAVAACSQHTCDAVDRQALPVPLNLSHLGGRGRVN